MVDFKKELIEKRKVLDERVSMYNEVIKVNLDGIKDLFKSSCLLVETEKAKNNSISLKLRKYEGKHLGWTSKDFTYDYAINKSFCSKTSSIENLLKKFILDIAQESYIDIEQELQSENKLIDKDIKVNNNQSIDFKSLINREEDKKKVIYGLFDGILEANLEGIKDIFGDNYTVKINRKRGGANILSINDKRKLGDRCCYIKYENINPNKSFGYTKEEIEEYLQRIVVAFVMEYDK